MSTPTKNILRPTAPLASTPKSNKQPEHVDSPGNWRHPRLTEISARRGASTFSEKHVRKIAYNVLAVTLLYGTELLLRQYTPASKLVPAWSKVYIGYLYVVLQIIPVINIGLALGPLFAKKDDVVDIPLTPSQRKLLGLPRSPVPPTPDTTFSTPPRYSRTPSISGSVSSRNAQSGSPLSGRGSPVPMGSPGASGISFGPVASSPLLQKAINGGNVRRSSFGSGSPAGLGVSTSASIFDAPTPSSAGKRSSVGLNNKWLYERGRRASGQNWHT